MLRHAGCLATEFDALHWAIEQAERRFSGLFGYPMRVFLLEQYGCETDCRIRDYLDAAGFPDVLLNVDYYSRADGKSTIVIETQGGNTTSDQAMRDLARAFRYCGARVVKVSDGKALIVSPTDTLLKTYSGHIEELEKEAYSTDLDLTDRGGGDTVSKHFGV